MPTEGRPQRRKNQIDPAKVFLELSDCCDKTKETIAADLDVRDTPAKHQENVSALFGRVNNMWSEKAEKTSAI